MSGGVYASTAKSEALTLPLLFEANRGQFKRGIDFLSRGPGYAVAIDGTQVTFSVEVGGKLRNVAMKVVNRCEDTLARGDDASKAVTNYLRGRDPKKWYTNVQTFRKVRYDDIYDGIDLVFHGTNRQIEYDFQVSPGALPDVIALDFSGVDGLKLTEAGDLLLTVGDRELRQLHPVAYQTSAGGTRMTVDVAFALLGDGRVGFEIGEYDPTRELVIDPVIVFSTMVGITNLNGIRVDAAGFIYLAGSSSDYDIPAPVGGYQPRLRTPGLNTPDVVLMKLSANANDVVWATYLGGTDIDSPIGLEMNAAGDLFVAGLTESDDFPVTPGTFFTGPTTGFFVSRVAANGSSLVYSMVMPYAASSVTDFAFTIDSQSRFVLAGESDGAVPTTEERQPAPKLTGNPDAYVMRLNASGTALDFSIGFGGGIDDIATAVVTDAQDNIYVGGVTGSRDFPIKNAAQPEIANLSVFDYDAFLTRFNASTGAMDFSTFWGGASDERVTKLLAAPDGGIVMFGLTQSADFPLVGTGYEDNPNFRGFVTRFATDGAVALSRYTGGDFVAAAGFNSNGELLVSTDHGVSVYSDVNASSPIWADPFASAAAVSSLGRNFYLVGDGQRIPTQPMPLTYPTGLDFNDHTFGKLIKVDLNAPTPPVQARISRIYPEGGKSTGGRTFDIDTISAFTPFTPVTVVFDNTAVPVSCDPGGGRCEGVYPAHAPGRVTVQAIDAQGNSISLQNGFTYVSPTVSINTVTPNRFVYPFDEEVVITGTGFTPGARVELTNSATEGGTALENVRVINETTIVARTVRMAAGVYGIRVINPHIVFLGGYDPAFIAFKAASMEFAAPASIFVNPDFYYPAIDNGAVTFSGTGLNSGMDVFFGGVQGEFVSFTNENGTDRLKIKAPALNSTGFVDIRIENGADVIILTRAFLYPGPTPVVRELRPSSGPPAGSNDVTLLGSGFSPDDLIQVGNIVVTQKTYIDQFTWLITMPAHHPGDAYVVVTNQHGGGGNGLDANAKYRYIGPFLREITPTFGSISGGENIEFRGTGFDPAAVAKIGGIQVNRNPDNFGNFYFTAPPHAAGYVDVEIINPDGSRGLIPMGFLYRGAGPTLTSITPNTGRVATQTFVTVVGTNFDPRMRLEFGGAQAISQQVIDSTTITGTVPAFSAAQAYNVTVRNPDGQTATLIGGFTLKAGPKINSIAPASGPAAGGTIVTIAGQEFDPAVQVKFGTNAAASVTWNSDTQLTAVTPPHAAGDVDVTVTNPDDFSHTKPQGFRYLPPAPTITGFTPNFAAPDDTVVITGTNFIFVTAVKFNTVAATFTVVSATQITAIVPGGSSTGLISVTTDSGTATSTDTFTLDTTGPSVTNFTPMSGTGGTSVTITGTKFTKATSIQFGGINASSFTINGATQITAIAPAGGNNGPICVTIPGPLTGCSASAFKFPPRVTTFSPAEGPVGTSVVIGGSNFEGATSVKFNGVDAGAITVNPEGTEITATVPAAATTGPLSVTTPIGTGTSTILFGIPPVITGFSPQRGAAGSGVTVTGSNLTHATSVKFNNVAATYSVVNDTTINATVPPTATTGKITVTSTPGGTAVSADDFTLAQVPVITSFTPTKGAPGTSVTINGANFAGAVEVLFNGVSASFTLNAGTITATVPATATNGPISIVNAEGTGQSASFFYLPPILSSFAPNAGSIGSSVTINGNNFLGATVVKFNSSSAPFVVNAQDKITATVPTGATTGALMVITPYGPVSSTFSYTVLQASTPTMMATATSATTVSVTWTGDPTHTYEVRRIVRKTDNFAAGVLGRVNGNGFIDTTAVSGVTYLYSILDVSTGLHSNNDFATTIMFTDDPLLVGTLVKGSHLTDLRAAVNAMRVAAGLTARTWTDPTPVAIRAVHMNELRAGLVEAYLSLARYVTFDDDPVPVGMQIRKVHVTELREAVK